MPTVHEHKINRAVHAVGSQMDEERLQENGETGLRHLAHGYGEFPVPDISRSTDMPVDRHIVGRIGDDQLGLLVGQQQIKKLGPGGIAVKEPMLAEQPYITVAAHGQDGRKLISRIVETRAMVMSKSISSSPSLGTRIGVPWLRLSIFSPP